MVALGAVFDSPGAAARESLRPDVARPARIPLTRLNAWGEAAEGVGYLAGPGLAGVLLIVIGGFGTLWTSVVLFGLAAAMTAITIPRHWRRDRDRSPTSVRWSKGSATCCGTARSARSP